MRTFIILLMMSALGLFMTQCRDISAESNTANKVTYGQFESQVDWGQHLVTVSACHDCHSPKNPKGHGLELDSTRLLSGYGPGDPEPDADLREVREKGKVVTTGSLTSWAGPWGVSYAANLTSDATGVGNWTEEQFMTALRKGKYHGLENARDLLPPMPWQMYRNFTDEEISAIFAFLKSTKPVRNIVPAPRTADDPGV